ncbi:CLUMA_CG009004, isoform A [Clunio marinus]|uniref:CLUMA_CG009004, isoform A n=1 Tax=Clunio marinus TaxID=568069 RepID=A0A1J1I5B8_9DIPT|nr:CLUMA_CG009004, isoform A [Clunio marinus]
MKTVKTKNPEINIEFHVAYLFVWDILQDLIIVRLLNGRPSSNNYFNSSTLQEWTRTTNVRIRLLRTKNFWDI